MPRGAHRVALDGRLLMAAVTAVLACVNLAGCSSGHETAAGATASASPRATSPVDLFYSANFMDPTAITAGPDGNLWFTDAETPEQIGRISTLGAIDEFADPNLNPTDITTGPDGALWFANLGTRKATTSGSIGRVTPTGSFSYFKASFVHMPATISVGADGNLWFTDDSDVGRLTPQGTFKFFDKRPTLSMPGPKDITKGPDGNIWVANGGVENGNISRVTPSGVVTTFTDAEIATPLGITAGPDGNIWFTSATSLVGHHPAIGRITPAGAITLFNDGKLFTPRDIVAGPDGNLWFTDESNHSIGRVTPAGVISYFKIEGYGRPTSIAVGPD